MAVYEHLELLDLPIYELAARSEMWLLQSWARKAQLSHFADSLSWECGYAQNLSPGVT